MLCTRICTTTSIQPAKSLFNSHSYTHMLLLQNFHTDTHTLILVNPHPEKKKFIIKT